MKDLEILRDFIEKKKKEEVRDFKLGDLADLGLVNPLGAILELEKLGEIAIKYNIYCPHCGALVRQSFIDLFGEIDDEFVCPVCNKTIAFRDHIVELVYVF